MLNPRSALLILALASALAACSSTNSTAITPLPSSSGPSIAQAASATPTLTALESQAPSATLDAFGAAMAAARQTQGASGPVTSTPTPLAYDLAEGQARAIAIATDTLMTVVPRTPQSFSSFPVQLTFGEFYEGYDIRSGLLLSDKLLSLDGQQVSLEGYMAPPLKPRLDWFVLTRVQLALCPFCSTAGDWPDDIALVYLKPGQTIEVSGAPLRLTGTLEVGKSVDPETGMVSLVRLYADEVQTLQ